MEVRTPHDWQAYQQGLVDGAAKSEKKTLRFLYWIYLILGSIIIGIISKKMGTDFSDGLRGWQLGASIIIIVWWTSVAQLSWFYFEHGFNPEKN